MNAFHKLSTAAVLVLSLAAVAQAAPSDSFGTAIVKTAYVKGAPVGVTIRGDSISVGGFCHGLFKTKGFTLCRKGGSRYPATACAWRITLTLDGSVLMLAVTTSRATLATMRPRVCPAVAQFLRGSRGVRSVRIR